MALVGDAGLMRLTKVRLAVGGVSSPAPGYMTDLSYVRVSNAVAELNIQG